MMPRRLTMARNEAREAVVVGRDCKGERGAFTAVMFSSVAHLVLVLVCDVSRFLDVQRCTTFFHFRRYGNAHQGAPPAPPHPTPPLTLPLETPPRESCSPSTPPPADALSTVDRPRPV